MALWDPNVSIRQADFFVSPCHVNRQVTLARYIVQPTVVSDAFAAVVIPIPRTAVRSPTILDASTYESFFVDAEEGYQESDEQHIEKSANAHHVYVSPKSHKAILVRKAHRLTHITYRDIPISLPRRLYRQARDCYPTNAFSFLVYLFRQQHEVIHLHFMYTHPLRSRSMFIPCATLAPEEGAEGTWNGVVPRMTIYSVNTSEGESLEEVQRSALQSNPKCRFAPGPQFSTLPVKLYQCFEQRRIQVVEQTHKKDRVLALGTVSIKLGDALQAKDRGDFLAAKRAFEAIIAQLEEEEECVPSEVYSLFAHFLSTCLHDYATAETYHDTAIRTNALNGAAFGRYAVFLDSIRCNHDLAELCYEASIRHAPHNSVLLCSAAVFYLEVRHDHKRALALMGRAVSISPNDATVVGRYALLQSDPEQTERLLRRAVHLSRKTGSEPWLKLHQRFCTAYPHVRPRDGDTSEFGSTGAALPVTFPWDKHASDSLDGPACVPPPADESIFDYRSQLTISDVDAITFTEG